MKARTPFQEKRLWRGWASVLGMCLAASTLTAADTNAPAAEAKAPAAAETNAPAAEAKAPAAADTNAPVAVAPVAAPLTREQIFEGGTNTYNNWVDVTAGGFITSGNERAFQERHQRSGHAYGGIEDLHYAGDIAKGTTVTVDGRGLFDEHDYSLALGVSREKLGYLRVTVSEFRTWYNGDGGFFPPTGGYFPLGDDALGLDRREISFEGGLTLENKPQVRFRYTHATREGDKSSTEWGFTHPEGGTLVRGLSPTFYTIDEKRDIFQVDVTHHIKATDFGVGMSYETSKLEDDRKITQFPGEAIQQRVTDREGTSYDMFNVHAFSETWFKKDLMFSSGFAYTDLNNDFSGSRIYGTDFDVGFVPNAQSDFGYFGLGGGSRMHEYVLDLNLLTVPVNNFTIVPSIRVQKEDWNADSSGMETLGLNAPVPFTATSDRDVIDVRERLDLTYRGVTNWVFWARGELTEGDGNLSENGGLGPVGGIGVPPIQRETDDSRFFQKYSLGARWYPLRAVTLDLGGYYKRNKYDYDNEVDSTLNDSANRYPAFLVMQDFETWDGNTRLTLRPRQNVTLVGRYEYQWNTIHTKPDPISGLSEVESSQMPSHIIGADATWTPWTRLSLQVGASYVQSETRTPASDVTRAILDAQNNYWMVNFSPMLVLDDRTDLKLSYFYYRANDYENNSAFGVPYGSGAEEHGVTATLTRRISKNLRLALRYGFWHSIDELYGDNRDYNAHLVSSTLQYRF